MIEILDAAEFYKSGASERKGGEADNYRKQAECIVAQVRREGDRALKRFAAEFDRAELDALEVNADEKNTALARVEGEYYKILERAAENIAAFHLKQLRGGYEIKTDDGRILGQRIMPVKRAGIYVPGGTASYPSTVLMNAIPAAIAGVSEIIMTTPPRTDGTVDDRVIAAAQIAGVHRIFKIGGAGAIAALAYGTESVPRVDKITGPGNAYVAAAKKIVFGDTGVDMVAGPSEILIISDGSSSAEFVAADMISQAEHDRLASAILITLDRAYALKVAGELDKQRRELPRVDIINASIEDYGKIIVADSLEQAAEIADSFAPEHLELCVAEPFKLFERVKNAGSVFLGAYAPEALGDYYAGANHTLPTGGSARFSSPLSVDDFVKKTQYIYYSKEALASVKDDIAAFAESEGLRGHAESVLKRFG